MIPLLTVLAAVAPILGVPPLRRRLAATAACLLASLVTVLTEARNRLAERTRLRLTAALLDLGNHLMLCDEERRARRLRRRLECAARRGRRPEDVLRRFGGSRADEVTFEAVVGSHPQEGNPARTLILSCTVARPPEDPLGAADDQDGLA